MRNKPRKHTIRQRRMVDEHLQLHLLLSSRFENVLTTVEVRQKGGKFLGTLKDASMFGYYPVPYCESMGQPVTEAEMLSVKNFAQLVKCRRKFYLGGEKPCVPVFYRGDLEFKNECVVKGVAYEYENKG